MNELNAPQRSHPMDELEAVQRLLAERPPPAPNVVAAARAGLERASVVSASGASPVHLNGDRPAAGPDPSRRWRRWRGLLAPVAAAAAVAVVIAISVAISGTVGSHAQRPAASTPAAFRQVPRYFVALTGHAVPDQGVRAEVAATGTGAVLGSVTVPRPYKVFTGVAAAGDDRTFVLAARRGTAVGYVSGRGPLMYYGTGPARFYKLVLTRSGAPAALTALPVPPVTGTINGFALSPDGSKLAVSVLPSTPLRSGRAGPPRGAQLMVFSLATGAQRAWTLPGTGWIGMNKPFARSLSWAGDNRTLLFTEQLGQGGSKVQVRLLDTAAPGGSLRADSRLVPFSARQLGMVTAGFMVLAADGTKIIAATTADVVHGGMTARQRQSLQPPRQCRLRASAARREIRHGATHPETPYCQKILKQLSQRLAEDARDHPQTIRTYATYSEFSVRTGKPAGVLGRMQGHGQTGADVDWASATGSAMIVDGPGPHSTNDNPQLALGVLAGGTFTPLPPAVQALLYSATW
jgi:hypothetical protein